MPWHQGSFLSASRATRCQVHPARRPAPRRPVLGPGSREGAACAARARDTWHRQPGAPRQLLHHAIELRQAGQVDLARVVHPGHDPVGVPEGEQVAGTGDRQRKQHHPLTADEKAADAQHARHGGHQDGCAQRVHGDGSGPWRVGKRPSDGRETAGHPGRHSRARRWTAHRLDDRQDPPDYMRRHLRNALSGKGLADGGIGRGGQESEGTGRQPRVRYRTVPQRLAAGAATG